MPYFRRGSFAALLNKGITMKLYLGFICLASLPFAANSQTPTATYTWQVSDDNGTSWSRSVFVSSGVNVKVRLLASWTGIPDAVGVGYAGGQFDVRLDGATSIGAVSNIESPLSSQFFPPQNLVASAIQGGLKIDTAGDVAPIGLGTGWVNPGQAAHFANPSAFNGTNGAVIFTFDFLSGHEGVLIDCVLNGTIGRAMAIYINSPGTQIRIDDSVTTVSGAILLIPTPGSLALLGIGGLAVARRRRSV